MSGLRELAHLVQGVRSLGLAVMIVDDSQIEGAYETLSRIVERSYKAALRPYRTKMSRVLRRGGV